MQDHRAINLFLFILPRNEGLPQKIQTTNLNLIDSLQEEDKKEQSHCAWFFGFPLQQIRLCAMESAERYDLAKVK